mgnify:CR=1 FL=1
MIAVSIDHWTLPNVSTSWPFSVAAGVFFFAFVIHLNTLGVVMAMLHVWKKVWPLSILRTASWLVGPPLTWVAVTVRTDRPFELGNLLVEAPAISVISAALYLCAHPTTEGRTTRELSCLVIVGILCSAVGMCLPACPAA